jgi:hypothetical protein
MDDIDFSTGYRVGGSLQELSDEWVRRPIIILLPTLEGEPRQNSNSFKFIRKRFGGQTIGARRGAAMLITTIVRKVGATSV